MAVYGGMTFGLLAVNHNKVNWNSSNDTITRNGNKSQGGNAGMNLSALIDLFNNFDQWSNSIPSTSSDNKVNIDLKGTRFTHPSGVRNVSDSANGRIEMDSNAFPVYYGNAYSVPASSNNNLSLRIRGATGDNTAGGTSSIYVTSYHAVGTDGVLLPGDPNDPYNTTTIAPDNAAAFNRANSGLTWPNFVRSVPCPSYLMTESDGTCGCPPGTSMNQDTGSCDPTPPAN